LRITISAKKHLDHVAGSLSCRDVQRRRAPAVPVHDIGAITLFTAVVESNGGELRSGTPQRMFQVNITSFFPTLNIFAYAPHPDGRFLVNVAEVGELTINVMTNWQKAAADNGKSAGR
jgi:hypothetical protein